MSPAQQRVVQDCAEAIRHLSQIVTDLSNDAPERADAASWHADLAMRRVRDNLRRLDTIPAPPFPEAG